MLAVHLTDGHAWCSGPNGEWTGSHRVHVVDGKPVATTTLDGDVGVDPFVHAADEFFVVDGRPVPVAAGVAAVVAALVDGAPDAVGGAAPREKASGAPAKAADVGGMSVPTHWGSARRECLLAALARLGASEVVPVPVAVAAVHALGDGAKTVLGSGMWLVVEESRDLVCAGLVPVGADAEYVPACVAMPLAPGAEPGEGELVELVRSAAQDNSIDGIAIVLTERHETVDVDALWKRIVLAAFSPEPDSPDVALVTAGAFVGLPPAVRVRTLAAASIARSVRELALSQAAPRPSVPPNRAPGGGRPGRAEWSRRTEWLGDVFASRGESRRRPMFVAAGAFAAVSILVGGGVLYARSVQNAGDGPPVAAGAGSDETGWGAVESTAQPAPVAVTGGPVVLTIPHDWAEMSSRRTESDGAGRLELVPSDSSDRRVVVTWNSLAADTTPEAVASALETEMAGSAGEFSDFDADATFAGRDALTYTEHAGDGSQVKWIVLLDGPVQVSVGCQVTQTRWIELQSDCQDIVSSVEVRV
ncbi:type VII secretion-associated protein [Rhodococcus sp. HNM0569]|uniref:type VII secretion-associated protein n=1 Tax=Rhodococcus sp. HNM0569 TaxID=2716340 RepID=UPI00146D169E|nr:type VII secretion-associated protein [Rhodococcus sp. HNM0569]